MRVEGSSLAKQYAAHVRKGRRPAAKAGFLGTAACAQTLLLCACGGGGGSPPSAVQTPPPPFAQLQHVIVIVQENRSFDNLFHGFPGADTVSSGQTSTGLTVPLVPRPFITAFDPGHGHLDFLTDANGGRLNGFDLESWGPQTIRPPPYFAYSYLPRSVIGPYWQMALQYTVADRMFQSNAGPSYPAHQYLIAGQSELADENPQLPQGGTPRQRSAWGCDDPPGTLVPTVAPGGDGPGFFPCVEYTTLGDLMDARGISWAYYAPVIAARAGGFTWSAFDAVKHVRFGSDWHRSVLSPQTRVLDAIATGNLRDVSWVVPDWPTSDHALATDGSGPMWVAAIVNAVGGSRYWQDTAVIVTWDDWGGWYDHVAPPRLDDMGLGFRVPLVVVAAYAKRGYVSHVQHEFGSILRLIEERFALGTLGTRDALSDDLSDCFDFSRKPARFTPIASASVRFDSNRGAEIPPDE
jgi:phospholipase C